MGEIEVKDFGEWQRRPYYAIYFFQSSQMINQAIKYFITAQPMEIRQKFSRPLKRLFSQTLWSSQKV